jgi:hypothetical protein
MLKEDWDLAYDYFHNDREYISEEGVGDYVGLSGEALTPSGWLPGVTNFKNPHPAYEFNWPIAQVATALIKAGLVIETLTEYPYANGWRALDGMWTDAQRRAWPPADRPSVPFMYSLSARKR